MPDYKLQALEITVGENTWDDCLWYDLHFHYDFSLVSYNVAADSYIMQNYHSAIILLLYCLEIYRNNKFEYMFYLKIWINNMPYYIEMDF